MAENRFFREALASMVAKEAYVDAIRHMYDIGMSADEIKKNLSYPVTSEKIGQVINEYETEKTAPEAEYEYIRKLDRYGRISFLKVKKDVKKE